MRHPSGTQIGPYRLTALLGVGGMGQVYAAEDVRLGRRVALKLLAPEFTENPERVTRFEREARAASALNHPNIVTIHDIGESEVGRFIVMELVDGITIRELIRNSPSFETVAEIGKQIAEALDVAHAAGIVHRDIKPENIMLRRDGYVKVLDFGLVRLISGRAAPVGEVSADATTICVPAVDLGEAEVSKVGAIMGTASYMSPEQAMGRPVSRASDLFSLGVMLYELATGVHPFSSPSLPSILHSIISHSPISPTRINPALPEMFDNLLLRQLEKDDHKRPSASEVRSTLVNLASSSEISARTSVSGQTHMVGREAHLEKLHEGLALARAKRSLLLCVSGEPGIGKSELVEGFLRTLGFGAQAVYIARGRCSERLAGTGAYLPFLEALESLLQTPQAGNISQVMKSLAPTWFRQLTPDAGADGSPETPSPAVVPSQELLKREMASFFSELSASHPLVLFLDDLHWADLASVDMLAYLATRFDAMRVLVVGTVRPTELMLADHPFQQVKLQLTSRGTCREIPLGFLSKTDIENYLSLEFPGHQFSGELASLIHARTEGSPLYMANILQHLKEQQIIIREQDRWTLKHSIPELAQELPESIRSMIQLKIDQLDEEDRRLLVGASVQGHEFDSAVLALALQMEAMEVEERLDRLENVHAFVRPLREHEFPEGTPSVRYQFVHVLYQDALYASLRPARRASLSGAVAEALTSCLGDQRDGVASELGLLWQTARDFCRAAENFQVAAQRAAGLCAHQETIALAQRGLQCLAKLPDTPDRAKRELELLTTLGPALMATRGWSSPEVQATYDRARELCRKEESTPAGFRVLRGLWQFYLVRGNLETARELAEQLYQLAGHLDDPRFLPESCRVKGETAMMLGNFVSARAHLEEGMARYDPQAELMAEDPGAMCPAMACWALWILGYPEQALQRSGEGVARAREIANPFSCALSVYFSAVLQVFRGDLQKVLDQASEVSALSREHGFGLLIPVASLVRGWAVVKQASSPPDSGPVFGTPAADQAPTEPCWPLRTVVTPASTGPELERMRRNLEECQATGAKLMWPFFLYLTADALGEVGRPEEALELVALAEDTIAETGDRWCSAELRRLKGNLLQSAGSPQSEIEACYREAIEMSRQQQAKSFELRATVALANLVVDGEARKAVGDELRELVHWFSEGHDTTDLLQARSVLES